MFHNIQGETANEIWQKAFNTVSKTNIIESRCGSTKELLHTTISINDPVQKWVTCKNPPLSIGYALAELIWILHGCDESKTINYWNPVLPQFAGDYEEYPGAYGKRIMYRYGFNQLERVYDTLKNHPESRQAVMMIWDPRTDLPQNNGAPNNHDIPCNICSMIKLREGKLEWTQVMRSNDLVLGLPYNIVQFTSIQEILASWLGVEVGTYNHISDSLHIYTNKESSVGNSISEYENPDSLGIAKDDFDRVIGAIYDVMTHLSVTKVDSAELYHLSQEDTGYEAYNNILKMICTYSAYKEHFGDTKEEILKSCSNIVYKVLWTNWARRKQGGISNV